MEVSSLIEQAFAQASHRYPDLHDCWIKASIRVGGLLPTSLLSASIQRDGRLDVVLRAMEDEQCIRGQAEQQALSMALTHQSGLSELWVGSIYETIRLLRDRGLAPDTAAFQSLARDLKLLRIPLEKHEITEERGLKKPLRMIRMPPNNDGTDIYAYRKNDPTRAHIMQSGISHQGSMMWQVIDLQARQERWIERRDLSDRFLSWAETVQAEINKSNETSEVNG